MTDLIKSYKEGTGCQDVEFRVWGTEIFKQAVKYIVLVCPKGCEKFKVLPLVSDAGGDIVKKDGENWTWDPQSSSPHWREIKNNKVVEPSGLGKYRRWETVYFLFYLEPGQYLPVPEDLHKHLTFVHNRRTANVSNYEGVVYIKGDKFDAKESKEKLIKALEKRKAENEKKIKEKREEKKKGKETEEEIERLEHSIKNDEATIKDLSEKD